MVKMNFGGTANGGVIAARVRPLAGLSGKEFIRARFIGATAANDASSMVFFRWMHQLADDMLATAGGLRLVANAGSIAWTHSGCWSGRGKGTTL